MSDYLKSKKPKEMWDAMRSEFKKDEKKETDQNPKEASWFDTIKQKLSGPTAAEAATESVKELFKKKKK